MSMIEKFMDAKAKLDNDVAIVHKEADEIHEATDKVASDKITGLIDDFNNDFEKMIVEASAEEFVEFITSGKLDDEELNAALMFRSLAAKKTCEDKPSESKEHCEKRVHRVRVYMLVNALSD